MHQYVVFYQYSDRNREIGLGRGMLTTKTPMTWSLLEHFESEVKRQNNLDIITITGYQELHQD